MVGTQGFENRLRRTAVAALTLLWLAARDAAAATCAVAPELWDRPRSGAAVASEPSIKPCIEEMMRFPRAALAIRYGASADLLAEEIRAWLIALALDAQRITLLPDGGPGSAVTLEVRIQP